MLCVTPMGLFGLVGLTFVSLVFSYIPSDSIRILFGYHFSSIISMTLAVCLLNLSIKHALEVA